MARTDPQVNIRLPEALVESLKQAAELSGKSLTAEIVERLEASFPKSFDLINLEAKQSAQSAFWQRREQLAGMLKLGLLDDLPAEEKLRAQREIIRLDDELTKLAAEIDEIVSYIEKANLGPFRAS